MSKKLIILFILFGLSFTVIAQNKFAGRIFDAHNGDALAFVNIIYNSNNLGTTTDLDGYFTIQSKNKIEFLEISYLGYTKQTIAIEELSNKSYIEISLNPDAFHLSEVTVLPGENPAHRIIKEVVAHAKQNNPENMRSFSYVSYNKMYFTIDASLFPEPKDSTSTGTIPEKTDDNGKTISMSVSFNPESDTQTDSTQNDTISEKQSLRDFFNTQHLFITESVTERRFKYPDNNKEEVLAHRMSGLSNPAFSLLTTQFQSFSFYKDFVSLMDKRYLSPISKGSTRKYFFLIEDTMYNENADTIFIISYRPSKGKNFDGLQGVLHINSNGYAIQNVSAKPYEPTGTFNINIQQKYELVDSVQWFPVQLNTDLIIDMAEVSNTSDGTSLPIVGVGKSYLSDISLNPDYKRREFNNMAIEVNDDANKKNDEFWDLYRKDSLTAKDIKTYEVVDSIGKEVNLDRTMEIMEVLATGYIPWKFLNFDPASILWYNKYENYRIGLAVETNQKMLSWVSIGGYFGYGFRDKAWKYGGHLKFNIHKASNTKLKIGYKQDLEFSDNHVFYTEYAPLSMQSIRDFFLSEMDSVKSVYTSLQFTTLRYLQADIRFNYNEKWIINTERYDYINPINKHYFNSELGIYLRYAYKEKFLQTPRGNKISMGTNYPILHINIIQGLSVQDASNEYLKTEARITKRISYRSLGDTYLSLTGGMITGDIQYSDLYYGAGSYSWINIDNTFNTMRVSEFISERFASIFFRHDFGGLLFKTKKWQPKIVIVSAAGWGDNTMLGETINENYAKSMNKGYYESGIQINNIFKLNFQGYGLGVYYRYGPYSRSKEIENWAFKLNLTFVM